MRLVLLNVILVLIYVCMARESAPSRINLLTFVGLVVVGQE